MRAKRPVAVPLGATSTEPPTAIFLHIPKTAGTTLHRILERHYEPGAIYTFGADAHASVAAFETLEPAEKSNIRLLRGHMPFGLHRSFPGPAVYFTVLREPVARVISYYNFILRTPEHYLYPAAVGQNLSLHELLEQGLPLMMNDGQVRLLSGVWGDASFGGVTEEHLATAIRNLQMHFLVVGVIEEFDGFLCLLQERLGWRGALAYERQNVSERGLDKTSLPEATLRLIGDLNRHDAALYQFADQLYRQQAREQGRLFPVRVRLFRWRNRWQPRVSAWRQVSLRNELKRRLARNRLP